MLAFILLGLVFLLSIMSLRLAADMAYNGEILMGCVCVGLFLLMVALMLYIGGGLFGYYVLSVAPS